MSLVSHSLPSLTGGVSQQPETLRFRSQSKVMENAWPSLIDGLQKRPPTEHHGGLFSGTLWPATEKPSFHWIDRSTEERYLVGVAKGETAGRRAKVFDLLDVSSAFAAEKVVKATTSAYNYLDSTNPEDYRFQTIADVTYIVNRNKQPAMKSRTTPSASPQKLMYVHSTLASNAAEDVVCRFNDTSTKKISDTAASTSDLAYNIYAELTGADASADAVTFNYDTDRVSLPGGHDYENGDLCRMTLTSGNDWPMFRKYRNLDDAPAGGFDFVDFSATHRFYTKEIDGNLTYLSWEPGGETIDLVKDNGSNVELTRVGTGSPPAGFEDLVVQGMPPAAGSATTTGNVFLLSHRDGIPFIFTVTDGAGDTLVDVYEDDTHTFTELPNTAVDGFHLTVKNDPSLDFDDYHVQFVADEGPGIISRGYWREVAAVDAKYQIDPTTMPHILVRQSDGSFTICEAGRHESDIFGVDTVNDRILVRMPADTAAGTPSTSTRVHFYQEGDVVWIENPDGGLEDDVLEYKGYYVKRISEALGSQTIELYAEAALSTKIAITAGVAALYGTLSGDPIHTDFRWEERTAGSELTNPDPTFIEEPIQDVAFFKNRLVFLAGENVILSESGQFFNFWKTTATQLLDTAPIDLASSWAGIARLETACAFEDLLYLSGNRVQFALGASGQQVFTAKSADIRMLSNLSVDNGQEPAQMRQQMYVPFTRGDYTGMYEYTPDPQVGGRFSQFDITAHVPQYIHGKIRSMASLEREGVLAVLGTDSGATGYQTTNSLYIYKTYKAGNKQIQSAWSKYTFHDADIRSVFFYEHELFIVMRRTSGWWVDKIGFKSGRVDTGSPYLTHLDRRLRHTVLEAEYDATTDTTVLGSTAGVPLYTLEPTDPMEVISVDGEFLTVTEILGGAATSDPPYNTVRVAGDQRGKVLWIGQGYTMQLTLSEQYMKEDTQSGRSSTTQGRFQLRRGFLHHADTSSFSVTVTPLNRTPYTYQYRAQIISGGSARIGTVPLATGRFQFPVNSKNDEVVIELSNDTPLPSNFTGAEFESSFTMRSSRVR